MNLPSHPLGWAVWRRGAILGLQWAAFVFVATLAIYLLAGLTGWSGVGRALCALATGPAVGFGAIAAWLVARRPTLEPADSRNGVESEHGGGS